METNHSDYTIAEIADRYARKEVVINRSYQRGGRLWPPYAKIYFIDTILEDYPFPKMYLYQTYDRAKRKPIMEVVDGQQRLLTIIDFLNDKIRLTKASKNYSGFYFSDLPEEVQERFVMYRIQADVILAAERPQLLEMFRRMNAYTAPLNSAEKRHSRFQGRFKWFVTEISDKISPVLEQFGVLTTKQLVRMADSEMISELILILESGIINRTEKSINDLYEKYDENFEPEDRYAEAIISFFSQLPERFSEIRNSFLMKPYAIHSFFAAYAQIKYGIPNGEEALGLPCRNSDIKSDEETIQNLLAISEAHETKDTEGPYGQYVEAALATTTKAAQRKARASVLAAVLDPA